MIQLFAANRALPLEPWNRGTKVASSSLKRVDNRSGTDICIVAWNRGASPIGLNTKGTGTRRSASSPFQKCANRSVSRPRETTAGQWLDSYPLTHANYTDRGTWMPIDHIMSMDNVVSRVSLVFPTIPVARFHLDFFLPSFLIFSSCGLKSPHTLLHHPFSLRVKIFFFWRGGRKWEALLASFPPLEFVIPGNLFQRVHKREGGNEKSHGFSKSGLDRR